MKIKELFEQNDSDDDFTEEAQLMKGKTIEFNGVEFKITSVDHRESFGQNFDFYVSPPFRAGDASKLKKMTDASDDPELKARMKKIAAKTKAVNVGHPYDDHAFETAFSEMIGLRVRFSESGMQGPNYFNVDLYPAKKKRTKAPQKNSEPKE